MITSNCCSEPGDELHAIVKDQPGAQVVEGAPTDAGQMPSRELDHAGIELDHGGAGDASVLQHLFQGAAVAAADDQDIARRAVGHERDVRDHLVIDELVALGGLDEAVEHEHASDLRRLEDDRFLECGAPPMDVALDQEPLPPVRIVDLFEPLGHHTRPRSRAEIATRRALNARRKIGTTRYGSAAPHMNTSIAA